MSPATRKTASYYGAWAALWIAVAFFGDTFADHGEYGECAHIVLLMTGPPFALLSLHIIPNGSVLATLAAGMIGLAQWSVVAEANARWEAWRKSRNG